MKLRNKKTGEIGYFCFANWDNPDLIIMDRNGVQLAKYNSLAELNEEWEDYEETKNQYYLDCDGRIFENHTTEYMKNKMKEIGNYFETKEEAEKAVEKLKAWKRLKDDGLKIREYELNGGTDRNGCFTGNICITLDITKPVYEDVIKLLFGDEE